mgnify:CR=1 FL=1
MEECRTERGNMDLVHREERLDDLQCKGYFIIQDPKRFCFGVDAVFLSEFTKVKTGGRVSDLGTGTGIIPILLVAKTGAAHITGLEIQQESAEMADRSVRFNGLTDRITIQQGDIKEAAGLFPAASFDVITSNPPYMTNQHGLENAYEPKNIARHEILCNLEDVIRAAAYLVKPGGTLRDNTLNGSGFVTGSEYAAEEGDTGSDGTIPLIGCTGEGNQGWQWLPQVGNPQVLGDNGRQLLEVELTQMLGSLKAEVVTKP